MKQKEESTSEYLKRVYLLELNDLDLTEEDTKEEVDRLCRKFDIHKVEDMSVDEMTQAIGIIASITKEPIKIKGQTMTVAEIRAKYRKGKS